MTRTKKNPVKLKSWLQDEALALGFSTCRVTGPTTVPAAQKNLAQYLDQGHHGTMDWMADTFERRSKPANLWREARSVILLAMNYTPHHDPMAVIRKKGKGAISVYAQHRDYHDVVKGKLKILAGKLAARGTCDVKVFVDTAPVMEKPLAEAAGLGWQGKHTNLVSRTLGSWFFLGSIFTTARLPQDQAESDHCGSCDACLTACPTNAFPAPYQIDARRCISYLTIEHKGPIPVEFRKPMGNRIYGCDDCLAACPWNKFAQAASEAKLIARKELIEPPLADISKLDDTAFRKFFSANPVKRTGRDRFMRNVLIALGNCGDKARSSNVLPHLEDKNPLVRGAAIWAIGQLDNDQAIDLAMKYADLEPDRQVQTEWAGVLRLQREDDQ